MTFVVAALVAIFIPIALLLALCTGYLLVLTVTAWFAPRSTELSAVEPKNRFAILVPAHNEEKLLPDLLSSLAELAYPKALYTVHVVADNCTDQTAQVAERSGAMTHVRTDSNNIGKGCALQWLFEQITQSDDTFDAALILDADSIVSTNFLAVMDAKLQDGANAIQAYYAVRDADSSWATGLRAAALAVLHYLRPQGRMILGLSAGLKGNGMVFRRTILANHAWSASVTEDIHYHMSLLLAGERVIFAPDAIVWAEIPTGLSDSNTQNERWEQGRLEMAKAYVPALLKRTLFPGAKGNGLSRSVLFDGAMEHIIPPFSILIGLNILAMMLSLGLWIIGNGMWAMGLSGAFFLAQVIYLISGMVLTKTSAKVYLAMLYLPLFLCWKIWLYIQVIIKPNKQGWVRTARIGEQR